MKSKILLSLLLSGSITCFAQGYKDGIEYYKVSEFDNAKELLERNLNDASTNKSEAYYYLGCVALENGNMKDAAMFLANAGDSPEAKNARGIFAAMNGDKEAALELFSQASSLEAARNNYRKIN